MTDIVEKITNNFVQLSESLVEGVDVVETLHADLAASREQAEKLALEVERLREALAKYGDRVRMSMAPAHLQQEIDRALAEYREAKP